MAKKKEPTKPYYPLAHEYAASLAAFLEASTQLYNVTNLLRQHVEGKVPPIVLSTLDEAIKAYEQARSGDE